MRYKSRVYNIQIEITDETEADPEDLELLLEDTLREGLPDSLNANIVSFEESDYEDN